MNVSPQNKVDEIPAAEAETVRARAQEILDLLEAK